MSLLDSFSVLFEADTGTLDKGLDKSEKGADDLTEALRKTDKEASKTGSTFSSFALRAAGALAAAVSVSSMITGSISRAAEVTSLLQSADAIGVAVEELDAFGRAAQAMGGDAQGARDSVTDMAESIGEALQDVESMRAKTFDALGVSLRDVDGNAIGAVEGIMAVADAVEGMSRQEAIFRIKELGITDNRTVEMVLRGRKALTELMDQQKESGVVTREQAEQARKFTETMARFRSSLESSGNSFMSTLIPALTKAVEWLTKLVDWASENQNIVVGFFGAIAGIVTAIYLPAMISAAAATLAATWPIIAIAAIVVALAAAFALAYDDIMAFVAGNDSFIGQIFEKFPLVEKIVMGVINHFRMMGQAIAAVFTFILDAWSATFDGIMAGVSAVRSGIQSVASFFGISGSDDVQAGQNAISAANASPLNSMTSNAISNSASQSNENNVQIGEVVVQTQATDAEGISRDIGSNLNDQLMQLDAEFSSGVAR